MRSTLHSPAMNFPQLFNPVRLADYVNHRLDHPVLQVPSGAPTYALSTSDEGVLLTRDGDKIGITEVPGISDWLVQRFDYWQSAFNHALETFYDTEPDTYGLEAYGVSIAADLADLLVNKAHVTYCGMGIHCELALTQYLDANSRHRVIVHGLVPLKEGSICLPDDAPMTPFMMQLIREGEESDDHYSAQLRMDYDWCGYVNSIVTVGEKTYDSIGDGNHIFPAELVDFIEYNLFQYNSVEYDSGPYDDPSPYRLAWAPHPWLFCLRLCATLIDISRFLPRRNSITYTRGKFRTMRPLAIS